MWTQFIPCIEQEDLEKIHPSAVQLKGINHIFIELPISWAISFFKTRFNHDPGEEQIDKSCHYYNAPFSTYEVIEIPEIPYWYETKDDCLFYSRQEIELLNRKAG